MISFSVLDLLNMVKLRLPFSSILAISFSASSKSIHQDLKESATRLINCLLSVLSGIGVSAQPLARLCTSDVDCEDPEYRAQVFCSPDGICGGGLAQCEPREGSPYPLGETYACVSGKWTATVALE
jgi:hypothetical protein